MQSNGPRAGERPTGAPTNQCLNCNRYISHQFARVFGNNDDMVYGCTECSTLNAADERSG